MGVTNYFSANGMLLGEDGPNGKVGYLTDALGSVTSTLNQAGTVLNAYRYKPYGAQLSKTGTAPDPEHRWAGCEGYRQTGLPQADVYVRARHYSTSAASWLSSAAGLEEDLHGEMPYVYVSQNPLSVLDPSGSPPVCEFTYGSVCYSLASNPRSCPSVRGTSQKSNDCSKSPKCTLETTCKPPTFCTLTLAKNPPKCTYHCTSTTTCSCTKGPKQSC
jgi:RHS repeat-associated protein